MSKKDDFFRLNESLDRLNELGLSVAQKSVIYQSFSRIERPEVEQKIYFDRSKCIGV